jgi:hypothetical protein
MAIGGRRFRAATTIAVLTLALGLPLGRPAAAQETQPGTASAGPSTSWIVTASKWGRWIALAGAAGLTTMAIVRNDDADRVYGGLQTLCQAGGDTCRLNSAGTYLNPAAEALYQETLRLDGQARRWMIAGQIALVAAGGMFLIDLVSGSSKPKNIPLAPLEVFGAGRKVGLRYWF